MRLFYSPGACSLASHIALEASGLDYDLRKIDVRAGEQSKPDYLAINPWSRVPALETPDGLLTENVAILSYIADLVPEKKLLPPPGTFERIRALEFMALMSATVHIGFRLIIRVYRFASTPEGQADVTETSLAALEKTLLQLETQLDGKQYALGDQFSLCDAYLLVFALWAEGPAVRGKIAPAPNLAAMGRRIAAHPVVSKVMADEDLSFKDQAG